MSNLLDDLKSRYHDVKLNIELTVIPTLKAIIRKRNISIGNEYFKQALEDFFDMLDSGWVFNIFFFLI